MHWSAHWSHEERSLFCVVHDITERRKLDQIKQEFVAMVSHDLRTPLTSVRGALSLILDGGISSEEPKGKKWLAEAQSNIDRVVYLINDLLDMDKLEAGMVKLDRTSTSVQDIGRAAVENVRGYASQQGIELKDELCDGTINGDKDRLIQVLVNLLANAIKFSDEGKKVVL